MYQYYLKQRENNTYDLIIRIDRQDAEFGLDFFAKDSDRSAYQRFVKYLTEQNKKYKIKTIRIFVSGLLVAVIPFQSATIAAAESKGLPSITSEILSAAEEAIRSNTKFHMTYLYGGTVQQQIAQVETVGSFQTVSPVYFDIDSQGNLQVNGLSKTLVESMRQKNIKVVPLLSNHWNRSAGEQALKNPEKLADQIVQAIHQYDLDGVNVDIENVTSTYRDAYTQLVRSLREKLPEEKEVSVAVAANPNGWTTGWHGSYDYAALGKYADYLMIMAYDESWQGSDPGPVASIDFVERSISYALQHVPAEKVVLGVPFYGRVWSEDGNFNGQGVSLKTLEKFFTDYGATITYSEAEQSPKAEFTVSAGDKVHTLNGKTLTPGKYTVWFENEQSLESKIQLVHRYNLKGLGSWSLSQAPDSILQQLSGWLQNEGEELDQPLMGKVTASSLRIRKGPTTSSETIGYLSKEEQVTIVGIQTGWYHIRLEDGRYGYVSADYIELLEEEQEIRTGYSTGSSVRIRKDPSVDSEILELLNKGESFTVKGTAQGSWYAIEAAGGISGYVHSDYVTFEQPVVTRTGYSSGTNVRLRKGPSTSSEILKLLGQGDSFTVVGDQQGEWYAVRLADGTAGYVHADYVTFTKPVVNRAAYSTGSNVRVRSAPTTAASILGHLRRGETFTVVGEVQNGWYEVRLSNRTSGYVHSDYVAFQK